MNPRHIFDQLYRDLAVYLVGGAIFGFVAVFFATLYFWHSNETDKFMSFCRADGNSEFVCKEKLMTIRAIRNSGNSTTYIQSK